MMAQMDQSEHEEEKKEETPETTKDLSPLRIPEISIPAETSEPRTQIVS